MLCVDVIVCRPSVCSLLMLLFADFCMLCVDVDCLQVFCMFFC